MSRFPDELVEDRQYVLRLRHRCDKNIYMYYTGRRPTSRLCKAKLFSLKYAKAAKHLSNTGRGYEVNRVTQKMLFKAALEGK